MPDAKTAFMRNGVKVNARNRRIRG